MWDGPDAENFETAIAYFEEATGADVRYQSAQRTLSQDLIIALEAGSAPNIAHHALPGLSADMAKRGFLTKLDPDLADWMRDNYAAGQSFVDLGTHAGPDGDEAFYSFAFEQQVKSLVWYIPENFEDAGYEIPENHGRSARAERSNRCRRWNPVVYGYCKWSVHRLGGK